MKKLTQLAAGALIAGSALVSTSAYAEGEVSYNIGFASEYYFRGIKQKDSSASLGADYTNGGFYIGTWAADVGDGLEVDGYFGYGIETESGFSASLGFTGYYYTGEFDDTYEEVNLNLGYGMVGFEYSKGEWDGFGADADYDFMALTISGESGFYGTYGTFGDDFDGDYIEIGYGTTIADLDIGIAAIFSDEDLSDELDSKGSPDRSEAVVFSIGKSF
ncbi:MAG: TorF family putative porin [Proteobacteria bacterium]|nr:TorF family putative porin [Pseudomonadota bacterium]